MSESRSGSVLGRFRSLFGRGTLVGMSEALLLERFVAHKDEEAFEALISRHGPRVLGICRRMLDDPRDIEDAFQATFLVLVRKAGSLRDRALQLAVWGRPSRGSPHPGQRLSPTDARTARGSGAGRGE
jgi:hypothetical protein